MRKKLLNALAKARSKADKRRRKPSISRADCIIQIEKIRSELQSLATANSMVSSQLDQMRVEIQDLERRVR